MFFKKCVFLFFILFNCCKLQLRVNIWLLKFWMLLRMKNINLYISKKDRWTLNLEFHWFLFFILLKPVLFLGERNINLPNYISIFQMSRRLSTCYYSDRSRFIHFFCFGKKFNQAGNMYVLMSVLKTVKTSFRKGILE